MFLQETVDKGHTGEKVNCGDGASCFSESTAEMNAGRF